MRQKARYAEDADEGKKIAAHKSRHRDDGFPFDL